jgi:hypothetical protein
LSFVKHIFNKESPDQIDISEIQKLIDNEIEESLHLDYEEIPPDVKYDGLAEHVSGFLNTSGGLVVFGVSETKKKGRHIPHDFTWTTIKKEAVENNLYQRIDPWYEDIQILPIQNPRDNTKRIFVIYVPKSKNSPHMANYRYYIRLNFQTRPLGHEQVSAIFKQNYLLKYDLIKTVYGPLYNELTLFFNQKRIKKWNIAEFKKIMRDNQFLLSQDVDFLLALDVFCTRIAKWNKALDVAPFRLAKVINAVAANFFKKQPYYYPNNSALRLSIRAESTHQFPHIDQAILNDEDPIDFWMKENPFVNILEAKIELLVQDPERKRDYITTTVHNKDFRKFMGKLKKEVEKDELIQYIRKEFEEMKSLLESFFFEELESRM